MTIKPVSKGGRVQEALTADTWNAFVRAANRNDLSSQQLTGNPGTGQEQPYSTVKVNCTTAAIARRQVLGLSDPSILPGAGQRTFDNRMLFAQTAPLQGRFGLAELAGSQNVYNKVISDGVVQCTVNVPANGEWITRADVDIGDATRLLATPNGAAQILWKETGTGDKPAIVRLGNPEFVALKGTANGAIASGTSSGVMRVRYPGNTDTNFDITGVHLDWMDGGLDISPGKEIIIGWFPLEQLWRVIHAECEEANPPAAGQIVDDGIANNQSVTTTPAPINAFVAGQPQEIATANVTVNAAAASITLPDVPAGGHVYRGNYNFQITPGSNNTSYQIWQYINGVQQTPPLITIDGRQSGTTISASAGGLISLASQSAPTIQLQISTASGSDTATWNNAIFSLERNLDF